MTGARAATARKNPTTQAEVTPTRSRRKRRHAISRGERPRSRAATSGATVAAGIEPSCIVTSELEDPPRFGGAA